MDLSDPSSAIVPSLDADVLAVLAGTTQPLTGREVQRLSRRGSHTGIQRILTRMAEHGLLDVTDAGTARLYTLNRDHVAATAALALLDLRGQLFIRIRDTLQHWGTAPVAAAVFGSAARGDGTPESDIDLFLLRPADVAEYEPAWAGDVAELARLIRRWSGNRASIIQATSDQIVDMIARSEPILDSLRRDAIPLTPSGVLDLVARA